MAFAHRRLSAGGGLRDFNRSHATDPGLAASTLLQRSGVNLGLWRAALGTLAFKLAGRHTDSRLGSSLREQRQRAQWTQAELATHAGLAAKTVGLLERGSGTLASWHAALRALGLSGRNLPGGVTLGLWVAKAHHEVQDARARTVVALLPARPIPSIGINHVAGRAVVYFLRGRLRFSDGEQSAPFPSALVVWGATPKIILALDQALPTAWRIK